MPVWWPSALAEAQKDGYVLTTPDEIQALYHRHLPSDFRVYNECHALLVRLGNRLCRRVPRCGECPLGQARWFTPAARKTMGI